MTCAQAGRSEYIYVRSLDMIQDIAPHQYHNEFTPCTVTGHDRILSYDARSVLVGLTDEGIQFPRYDQCQTLSKDDVIWAFSVDDIQFFLSKEPIAAPPGFHYVTIRHMRYEQPRYLAYAAVVGLSLSTWYGHHHVCGSCGKTLVHSKEERMLYCPTCGIANYPRINPAVIVAVRNGNRLLLSKYAGREYKNVALLAGFAEIGETIEETVHREVREEVGIAVKNLEFYKSQPWVFTDTLLFGFFCDVNGDDTLHVDHDELAVAAWVDREDLPDDTEEASLTMEMVTLFKKGLK